ncbi:MAG: GFA family protein [Alphaproteobacteria bacterium]
MTIHKGGCMCGAVRFEADGPPKWTGLCHCASCRKHSGAPVAAFAGYEANKVQFISGAPTFYASSPGVRRGFCGRCGATLTFEGAPWPGEIHLHIGAFDRPADFPPEGEGFPEERLAWLHVSVDGVE